MLETVVSDDSHQKIALGNKFRLGTQSLFWDSSKTDSSKEDSFDSLVKEDRELKFTIFTAWNKVNKDLFSGKVDEIFVCGESYENTQRFSNLEGRC